MIQERELSEKVCAPFTVDWALSLSARIQSTSITSAIEFECVSLGAFDKLPWVDPAVLTQVSP